MQVAGRPELRGQQRCLMALRYLRSQGEMLKAAPGGDKATPEQLELSALTNLCQQLISSNEFLYVD